MPEPTVSVQSTDFLSLPQSVSSKSMECKNSPRYFSVTPTASRTESCIQKYYPCILGSQRIETSCPRPHLPSSCYTGMPISSAHGSTAREYLFSGIKTALTAPDYCFPDIFKILEMLSKLISESRIILNHSLNHIITSGRITFVMRFRTELIFGYRISFVFKFCVNNINFPFLLQTSSGTSGSNILASELYTYHVSTSFQNIAFSFAE